MRDDTAAVAALAHQIRNLADERRRSDLIRRPTGHLSAAIALGADVVEACVTAVVALCNSLAGYHAWARLVGRHDAFGVGVALPPVDDLLLAIDSFDDVELRALFEELHRTADRLLDAWPVAA